MTTPSQANSVPPEPLPKQVALVLLVDDQAMIGEAVRRCLSGQEDIDFHFCADPAQAESLAARISPTVILQDLVMPGMDGLELVARYRLHPATHDIPVVVLSTKEDAQVKSDAFEAGANDYLVKLPDKIELLARIRYHSKAYTTQIERDQAFRALQESQRQLMQANASLLSSNQRLEAALEQVTQLQGLLPICSFCKQIRDDKNYWSQVDSYFAHHSAVRFTHGICPECLEKNYGEWMTSPEKNS